MIGISTLLNLKKNGMTTLIKNLKGVKKVFGFITKVSLLILLVLTTCTCSGPRLMLGSQTFANQIDYSISFGRHARQTRAAMECVILRTDVLDSRSWPQVRPLIRPRFPQTRGLEFYPNQGPTLRRCLQIKWYQYRSIFLSSSNQSRTVWTGRRPNLPIGSQHRSLRVKNSTQTRNSRKSPGSTQRSTGRTPATTRTTVKN